MTYDDVIDYLIPVLVNLWGPDGNSRYHAETLDDLLGLTEYHEYKAMSSDKPISEEYKKHLIALAGPHPHTVLKMIRINKGLE